MRFATLVKLGAFLAVAAIFAAMEVGTLTGPRVGSTDTYYAYFNTPDGVSGLRSGNPVQVSGVPVGKVTDIRLVNATEAKVTFTANHDQVISSHTWAVVRYANLLGQRFLELDQQGGPGVPLRAGGRIPAQRTRPALSLTALFNGFRPLFSALTPQEVNELSQDIIDVLQGDTGRVDDLVARTADLASNLADRDQAFDQVVDSVTTLLKTVAGHDAELAQTLTTLQALTGQLQADGPAILDSVGSVDGLMGSVSQLLGAVNQQNQLPADIADAESVTGVLAKNSRTLAPLVNGFVQAFGDFDRITQNGSWINAYLCAGVAVLPGHVSVDADDALQTLDGLLHTSLGGLLTNLLNGLGVGQLAIPVPLSIPQGTVGDPGQSSKVCR